MVALGVVSFALAISLHILLARVIAERLAKLVGEQERRKAISRMWSRSPG